MIKIENTEVFGWEAAIRGMRNPKDSWHLSDSYSTYVESETGNAAKFEFFIGEKDMKLMQNLRRAGSDHRKYLRMIDVQVDITAPLYWWKEFDTYKVGTVADSCSTMHKIQAYEFTLDMFSHEHLTVGSKVCLRMTIDLLNRARDKFLETGEKDWWWQMIQLLPSSFNQKRTVQLNYEVLLHMYNSRKGHKLDEWQTLREWIEQLPYFKEICLDEPEHVCNCGGTCGGNCKCGGHHE